jgi:hypothetical protein
MPDKPDTTYVFGPDGGPPRRRTRSRSPLPAALRSDGSEGAQKDWAKYGFALLISALIGGGGGGLFGAVGATSLSEYRIERLERDLREHEASPWHGQTAQRLSEVGGEVEAVEARRQADVAIVTQRLTDIVQRLDRIEAAVSRRRRGRGR